MSTPPTGRPEKIPRPVLEQPAEPRVSTPLTAEERGFAEFLSALKAVSFYPEGNPVRERMLAALVDTLATSPAGGDGLEASWTSERVLWAGIPVVARGGEGWESMTRLFEAGLRSLTFLPALSLVETERLLSLLARTIRGELNPTDEDLSVMLWEMDLPAIAYHVLDTLDDPLPLQTLDGAPQDTQADEQEEDDTRLWEEMHPLERYVASAGGLDTTDMDARTLRTDESDLAHLRNQAKSESVRMRRKMVMVLGEILLLDLSPAESRRVLALIRRFAIEVLQEGHFDTYVQLVHRFRERLNDLPGDLGEGMRRLTNELSGLEAARQTLGALESLPCDNEKMIVAFLSELQPDGLQLVFDHVAAEEEASARAGAGPGIPAQAIARAMVHRPQALLGQPPSLTDRHLRALARLLPIQTTADQAESWSRQLVTLQRSPEAPIRMALLEFLAACRSPNLDKRLLRSLDDEDGRVRKTAALLMSRSMGAGALQPLLQVLLSRDFDKRDFDEQAALYEALASSSPEEVFPLLERTVSRRDWLAPSHWRVQKACALRALGLIPIERSGPLLMKYRDAKDPLLAEASRSGLERHRRSIQGTRGAPSEAA